MATAKKPHVLLVEDNPADVALLEELMEEEEVNLALCCTQDGHEALDYLNAREKYKTAQKPDVILLDLGLPKMNGYEVLETIRCTLHLSAIPVIVLTTSRDPKDEELCLKLGANAFLSKPYDLAGYEALVHRLASDVIPGVTKATA